MKAVYLIVQAISFVVVGIGKGIAFIFHGIPHGISLQLSRFPFWEQRILWGLLIPIYFFVIHVPLSWWIISSYPNLFGLILGLIGYWILGLIVQCVGLYDGYFDRDMGDNEKKYIPSKDVKWYNLKEELANKKAEAEKKEAARKAAVEAEREKDPDYVEAARDLGVLPKPRATFDYSYEYRDRTRKEAALSVSDALKQIGKEEPKRLEWWRDSHDRNILQGK